MTDSQDRSLNSQWGSKVGFIAAAAGSAVGLGNLWKFPYITGENGGGTFVLFYLFCIIFFGVPLMIAEVLIGRTTQSSPVRALGRLTHQHRGWQGVGFLGVFTGAIILSFYSVVAGWGLHYLFLAIIGGFPVDAQVDAYADLFNSLYQSEGLNIWWHTVFMIITSGVILGGVKKGLEKVANGGMVLLFFIIIALAIYGATLSGFGEALSFVFGSSNRFTWKSALEALGHAFFSLSLGMGAMLTYGSYLRRSDDGVVTSMVISLADTIVAIGACLVLFPITFSVNLEPSVGPGLVFINIPLALLQLPLGRIGLVIFFILLFIAALTSAISLLEVVTSFLIDSLGWKRTRAASICAVVIYFLGIPSALSGGEGFFGKGLQSLIGKTWFDTLDYLSSNWLLPLGGLGLSLFMGWRMESALRQQEFGTGSPLGRITWIYSVWLFLIRWITPLGIGLLMFRILIQG